MKKVFIGGSRKISRLNSDIRERLERIIERHLEVLVGDANGADRAVQQYFKDRNYSHVLVFCMEGHCRNNVGNWPVEVLTAPKGVRGAEFYSIKDRAMTDRSSVGLMLWDGQSSGTLANVSRLIEQHKPVVLYHAKLREFATLRDQHDLRAFVSNSDPEVQARILAQENSERVLF